MVLMSDTGGGHRASAEALQAGFEQLYGNDFQASPCNASACCFNLFSRVLCLVSLTCSWPSAWRIFVE